MQSKRILFTLFFLLPFYTTFSQPAERKYSYSHPQMGTTFKLVFYSRLDSTEAQSIAKQVFYRIDSLNLLYSDYLPESELNRLCDQAGNHKWVDISSELWNILNQANYFTQTTNGAFDISLGAITRLWRKARSMKELPDSTAITKLLQSAGHACVQLNSHQQARINQPGTRLDLGGIAQGFTADLCLKMLKEKGIRKALVDAGGDLAIGDPPPFSSGWLIQFPNNNQPENTNLESLWLSNCGITTSGATTRFLEINNTRYSHIINPKTGWALTNNYLVTVKAPNATIADAWATALNVLGPLGWENVKEEHPELEVWITQTKL